MAPFTPITARIKHVSDLASAHVLAMRYLEQGGESTVCNLGTGTGITVRQVIEMVAEASRARELLGWTPVRSDLRSIVETAYRWHVSSGE